jgi:hypothetical protein
MTEGQLRKGSTLIAIAGASIATSAPTSRERRREVVDLGLLFLYTKTLPGGGACGRGGQPRIGCVVIDARLSKGWGQPPPVGTRSEHTYAWLSSARRRPQASTGLHARARRPRSRVAAVALQAAHHSRIRGCHCRTYPECPWAPNARCQAYQDCILLTVCGSRECQ